MIAGDSDFNQCTPRDTFRLEQQAVMLVQAYHIAKEEMIDRESTWDQCCKESVKWANRIGMVACTKSETLQDWHHSFVQSPEGLTLTEMRM